MRVWALAILAGVLLAGCADTGATEEELHEARARGERAGEANGQGRAEARAAGRIQAAREEGELAGEERGWNEGWEEAEEAMLEEETSYGGGEFSPHPLKENGERSYEFEPEDIERAEEGYEDDELREYCEGAVSEAQEAGCLSHVNPWEVP